MITSTATISTLHAERYLRQLCKHWSHKLHIEDTGAGMRITMLNKAVALMRARKEGLDMTIDAVDTEALAAVKDVVERHLDRFAFREAPLTFYWTDRDGAA